MRDMKNSPASIVSPAKALGLLLLSCLSLVGPSPAQAQAYPIKPIRLIVPFPPSGSTDIVARTVAERLGVALGQNVIIDNKPGATGAIGLEALARAEPDGYTIGLGTIGSIAINPTVNRKLSWDPIRDFAPVGYVGSTPFVLLLNPGIKANTVDEFLALARTQPGKMTYATGGNGGSQHVAAVLLEDMGGISMTQIPYKGSNEIHTAVASGDVTMSFDNYVSPRALVDAGKLRALVVTTAERAFYEG